MVRPGETREGIMCVAWKKLLRPCGHKACADCIIFALYSEPCALGLARPLHAGLGLQSPAEWYSLDCVYAASIKSCKYFLRNEEIKKNI